MYYEYTEISAFFLIQQSLLHNALILGAVFNMDPDGPGCEPSCTMRRVVSALQESFAHMSRGRRGVHDIRRIVGMLTLSPLDVNIMIGVM